jgi:hypothetical protein
MLNMEATLNRPAEDGNANQNAQRRTHPLSIPKDLKESNGQP